MPRTFELFERSECTDYDQNATGYVWIQLKIGCQMNCFSVFEVDVLDWYGF